MKISVRGWLAFATCAAMVTVLVAFSVTRLRAADQPAAVRGQLTEESLGTLLEAMGLQAAKVDSRYDFAFKAIHNKDEWELSMSAVLSRDGTSVWLMAWLDELPHSAADVPRTALLRLLADNDHLGNGKFFAYIAANRRFVMQRILPNENISTATFRAALQDLGIGVVETYPHWSVANWRATDSSSPVENTAQGSDPASRSAGPATQTVIRDSKFDGGAARN